MAYWLTAFKFVKSDKKDIDFPRYISEIHKTGRIKIFPPEINSSSKSIKSSFDSDSIYWDLSSISMLGEVALQYIIDNSDKEGNVCYSFDEFLSKFIHKGSKVNKRVIENLIICGAFDKVENLNQPKDRLNLIEKYRDYGSIKIDEAKDIFHLSKDLINFNWWWQLNQKKLCGFAIFDYKSICLNFLDSSSKMAIPSELEDYKKGELTIGIGVIKEIKVRKGAKGEFAILIIDHNFEEMQIKIWTNEWDLMKESVMGNEGGIIICSGTVVFDKYSKGHQIVVKADSEYIIL